jgi:hypothetical protein
VVQVADRDPVAAIPPDLAADLLEARVKVAMPEVPEAGPVPAVDLAVVHDLVVVQAVPVGPVLVGAPVGSVDHRAVPVDGVVVAIRTSCSRNT